MACVVLMDIDGLTVWSFSDFSGKATRGANGRLPCVVPPTVLKPPSRLLLHATSHLRFSALLVTSSPLQSPIITDILKS